MANLDRELWLQALNDIEFDDIDIDEPENQPTYLEILEWYSLPEQEKLEFSTIYKPDFDEQGKISDQLSSFYYTMQDYCEMHFEKFSKNPKSLMIFQGAIYGKVSAQLRNMSNISIRFIYESGHQNLKAFYIEITKKNGERIRVEGQGDNPNSYMNSLTMRSDKNYDNSIEIISHMLDTSTFVCDRQSM